MTRLFVAAVGLDCASFLVLTALVPVTAFELNPIVVALTATAGVLAVVAVKIALGLGVALTFDRLRPAARFRLLLGMATVVTLVGAASNVAAMIGGLA